MAGEILEGKSVFKAGQIFVAGDEEKLEALGLTEDEVKHLEGRGVIAGFAAKEGAVAGDNARLFGAGSPRPQGYTGGEPYYLAREQNVLQGKEEMGSSVINDTPTRRVKKAE